MGAETFEGEPEPFAGLAVFDESFEGPVIEGDPTFVEFGESAFAAELELFETEGWSRVGMASAAGTYEQAGDLEVIVDERFKDGNRWIEERIEAAPLAVEGLLYLEIEGFAPVEHDVSECEGAIERFDLWYTNPTAYIFKGSDTALFCELEQDGWFLFLEGLGDSGGGERYVEVFGPEREYFGFTDQFLPEIGSLILEVDLWEPGFEDPTATATIDAFLATGEPFSIDIVWQEFVAKIVDYKLIVEGSLMVPEFTFDMSDCGGRVRELKIAEHPDLSQGKGKVPANDTPDSAALLTNRINDQTRMASPEPEAACSVFDEEQGELFDLPIGKTVWYLVEGTGGPVTVDTAGSDFDTIVGIYVMAGDELVQETCLDDVVTETGITTLAAIEIDTIEGETYYVQMSGFGGEYGHLKVEVR